jgi:hypothetical protein
MRSITFEINGRRPSPMSKPSLRIHWTKGQEERPKQYAEWSDNLEAWLRIVQAEAEKVMRHEKELLSGPLKAEITIHWKRPDKHYSASGKIKDSYAESLPTQSPLLLETARGIAWAMERIVYYDRDQIVYALPIKIWGSSHKTVVTVSQITARDVDPTIASRPQQGELGL